MDNTKYNIITVAGIRPDFIRYSKIWELLDSDPNVNHVLVHTGQHYDDLLSGVFFDELDIRKPDVNLHIGAPGRDQFSQAAKLLEEFSAYLLDWEIQNWKKPDLIVFLGDTNSVTVVPALRKEGYNIAHIEAGMRSYDYDMPEEINRVCCDHNCQLLFTYHENYKKKLMTEGIHKKADICVVGNTILEVCWPLIKDFDKPTNNFILVDVHRHENLVSFQRYQWVLDYAFAMGRLHNLPVKVIKFPRAEALIKDMDIETHDLEFVDLMPYKNFLRAQYDCKFLISDSGTAQEEALLVNTPVLVPRSSTERPESLDQECSFMVEVGQDLANEVAQSTSYLNRVKHVDLSLRGDWLGDGHTAEHILKGMKDWINRAS